MKIGNCISILFAGLILFGFLFLAEPCNVEAGQEVTGCCQFIEGDEPGCWYPSEPGPCANLKGTFLAGEKCDLDTGYCSGYQKDKSKSSESKK